MALLENDAQGREGLCEDGLFIEFGFASCDSCIPAAFMGKGIVGRHSGAVMSLKGAKEAFSQASTAWMLLLLCCLSVFLSMSFISIV